MSSNLRIGGLASGMDIDQIVKDLVKVERMKVDKIKQDKQVVEWQREDYRDINNSLRSLRDSAFNMKLQSTFLTKKVTSSNEGIVKVTGSGSALVGASTIKVTELASNARLNSIANVDFDSSGTNLKDQLKLASGGTVEFTVNGSEQISIDTNTETIDALVSKINSAKKADGTSAGVTAYYDKTLNRMFISSNKTGSSAKVDIDLVSGEDIFTALKLGKSPYDTVDPFSEVSGTNAAFELNGMSLSQESNQFTIAGINYTLTGTSITETVNINVTNDTDTVFNSIKSFVELYNTTIDKINGKLSEERYRDYSPLTDEQREELSDDQEEKWEEKAKSGLLKNDSVLSSAVYKMRATMSSNVPGVSNNDYDSLAEIGIKTLNYSEKGKLHIDETKLKEALAADPQAVMEMFTATSDNYSEKGIAGRLYDDLTNSMNVITDKAGSSDGFSQTDNSLLGKRISGLDDDIDRWEDRLIEVEERYWRQFTAMEKAISQMNSQSAWLAQQFGG